MITRRIVDGLRQQQWTSVGIELLILVLGVFLGMQVSNWNAERIEQERATKVLDALRADMRDYIEVTSIYGERTAKGLASFDAARARGDKPAPFFIRFTGSDRPPTSVWQVAQQSGLAELVHPSLMFELGYYYSEVEGIGEKYVRYAYFVESEILSRVEDPEAFYDQQGNLKPVYQQSMQRLREWAAYSAVTVVSANCLMKRFEFPKDAGPSCRPDYSAFDLDGNKP